MNNFENSRDITSNYSDSSYSSVTYTTIHNHISDSFNQSNSGQQVSGGGCAVVFLILGLVPLAGFIALLMWLAEVLT